MNFSVEGIEKVNENLERRKKEILSNIKEIMPQIGLFLESEVKQSIAGNRDFTEAVDTGRLLNSVQSQTDDDDEIQSVIVYSDVEYAPYIEYGTSRNPNARPNFNNTLDKQADYVTDLVSQEVKKVL